MDFMEIKYQKVLKIKKFHFYPTTSEAYKILKERSLTVFLFLFCPTSFHAAGEF